MLLGRIAIYVVLEKSYHLLKWDFVVDTPRDIGGVLLHFIT